MIWQRTIAAAVGALTLATSAPGGCGAADSRGAGDDGDGGRPLPGACRVDTRGIEVEGRLVVDVLTARCNPSPQTHTLEGWLEHRDDTGRWVPSESTLNFTVPDAEGTTLRVVAACVDGRWRARWKTYGIAPIGRKFREIDGDLFSTSVRCER